MVILHPEFKQLTAAVRRACPKPHRLLQHADGLPPWCHVCGRTEMGDRIQIRGKSRRTTE